MGGDFPFLMIGKRVLGAGWNPKARPFPFPAFLGTQAGVPNPNKYPKAARTDSKRLTPGMVQRAALGYLLGLGTPACVPRNAGKGKGRDFGFQPAPRTRFSIIKKGISPPKQTVMSI